MPAGGTMLDFIAATAGAGICTTAITQGLVPSGILWMGLASLGSSGLLGHRGMGLGRRAMVGILWRVVGFLSRLCGSVLLVDGLSDLAAVAGSVCGAC